MNCFPKVDKEKRKEYLKGENNDWPEFVEYKKKQGIEISLSDKETGGLNLDLFFEYFRWSKVWQKIFMGKLAAFERAIGQEIIDEDAIATIVEVMRISELYGLAARLMPEEYRNSRPSDTAKKLERIANLGENFIEAIEEFVIDTGFQPRIGLMKPTEKWFEYSTLFRTGEHNIVDFIKLTKELKEKYANIKNEEDHVTLQDMLFKLIGGFYRRVTKKKPSVYWDNHAEMYKGKFLVFCSAFAPGLWPVSDWPAMIKRLFPPEKETK
ncbi:hypothetical protein [Desulforegula conservatrix]|uniref:hypothetical protein n=1 Tax=Desulforegula conservatrix TaxID=153026 RepID=UPI0003FE4331|nr:hypothetical protein [Desulforegula conservatrix]